ncbi:hypothetical protein D9613_010679 [Agrocybe pediades]|uniref:Cytochrome P450 n=1 Tax=Agrocybe pediades TaxID=84607 RepID=A0A8H4QGB7_9AGAR|nr:hypothetical protein D9613_010679 [Agrocybe pediades]
MAVLNALDIALVLLTAAVVYWILHSGRRPTSSLPKPPGPKPWPVIGNLLDMPRKQEWETFSEWATTYGDIVYVNVAGHPILILNTVEVVTDLLLERSMIYSDRPSLPLVDLLGHPEFNFTFMQYGKELQEHRKVFANGFKKSRLSDYYDTQYTTTISTLRNMRDDPVNHRNHFRLHAGQLIISATYGLKVESFMDPLIQQAEAALAALSFALSPVMWVVNPVPIFSALPTWLGGSNLARWKQDLYEIQYVPFNRTKQLMAAGSAPESFSSTLLQELDAKSDQEREEAETIIRDCATVAYGGASDTTVSVESSFLLAMLLYPQVQERAQKEIDSVVENDRLPTFEDRSKLPYITGIVKEALRWHSPAPQGIPHKLTRDDEYQGLLLPGGSLVMINVWHILQDPKTFKNPNEFRPERHLPEDPEFSAKIEQASRIVFGSGKRACPGQAFAEDALWLLFARFLAVFSVGRDPAGGSPTKPEFQSGSLSHPVPFKCDMRVRSATRSNLLDQE